MKVTPSRIVWEVRGVEVILRGVEVILDHRGVTVSTSGVTFPLGSEVDALVETITTAQELADSNKWWVPEGAGGRPC